MNFLKTTFNILRNFCFLIVIILILIAGYLYDNQEIAQSYLSFFQSTERPLKSSLSSNLNFTTFGFSDSFEQEITSNSKLKIPIKNGVAFFRPSQIMYIESNDSNIELNTTGEAKIEITLSLNNSFESLQNLENGNFFKTKNAILNCHYIQQLIRKSSKYGGRYNYQYYVIMEDKSEIKISERKHKDLKTLLEREF